MAGKLGEKADGKALRRKGELQDTECLRKRKVEDNAELNFLA